MGLDFSHGDAHFGYGGFMGFRNTLCDVAGLGDLWGYYRREKSFDNVDDVIKILLNHSDCDGELTVEECKLLIPRLTELIDKFDDDDYDKVKGRSLVDSMQEAVDANEPLEFC